MTATAPWSFRLGAIQAKSCPMQSLVVGSSTEGNSQSTEWSWDVVGGSVAGCQWSGVVERREIGCLAASGVRKGTTLGEYERLRQRQVDERRRPRIEYSMIGGEQNGKPELE